jgi:hypothetical protein
MCCQSSASPPSAWLKKCVPTFVSRSIESIVLHSVTAGMAKRIMNDAMRIDQTNSGMRLRLMPGARHFRIVTIIDTAPAIEPISTSVTICDHTSTRFPGLKSGPARGG